MVLPCECSVCDHSGKHEHGGDGVGLVEELKADVIDRTLVDGNKVIGGVRAMLRPSA